MFFTPPPVIEATPFTRVPEELRLTDRPSAWAHRQARGPIGAFLEGAVVRSGREPVARGHRARAHLPGEPGRRMGGGRPVRRPAERAQDPPGRPGLHRRLRARDHGARSGERAGRALPRPGALSGLQGLQRPLLRLKRRPLLHRPGVDRAARSDRPGVAAPGRGRAPRVPHRHRPEPERARHGPRRVAALHRGDPGQRGLADALRHEGPAVQGRALRPAPGRGRWPGRDGDGRRGQSLGRAARGGQGVAAEPDRRAGRLHRRPPPDPGSPTSPTAGRRTGPSTSPSPAPATSSPPRWTCRGSRCTRTATPRSGAARTEPRYFADCEGRGQGGTRRRRPSAPSSNRSRRVGMVTYSPFRQPSSKLS